MLASGRVEPGLRLLLGLAPLVMLAALVAGNLVIPMIRAEPWLGPSLFRPCVLESATSVPCPFCGGTRSFVAFCQGDLLLAFQLSPLAFFALASALTVSAWLGAAAISGHWLGLPRVLWAAREALTPRSLVMMSVLALSLTWLLKLALVRALEH